MDPVAIAALVNSFTELTTTLAPQMLALVQAAKVSASSTDLDALNAAEAKLAPINDALHVEVQSL